MDRFVPQALARLSALAAWCAPLGCANTGDVLAPFQVNGDSITAPLSGEPADAGRGRAIVAGRDGNCLLCHALVESGERFMGDVGPPLSHVATRLTEGQMRLRIVDSTRVNRDTSMPPYYRVEGLDRVAAPFRGKPILTAQQIEDVIAYLRTLR